MRKHKFYVNLSRNDNFEFGLRFKLYNTSLSYGKLDVFDIARLIQLKYKELCLKYKITDDMFSDEKRDFSADYEHPDKENAVILMGTCYRKRINDDQLEECFMIEFIDSIQDIIYPFFRKDRRFYVENEKGDNDNE